MFDEGRIGDVLVRGGKGARDVVNVAEVGRACKDPAYWRTDGSEWCVGDEEASVSR